MRCQMRSMACWSLGRAVARTWSRYGLTARPMTRTSCSAMRRTIGSWSDRNALPDAVDGLLELGSGCGSNLVQVRLDRAAHDQDVLFRHAAHDRIVVRSECVARCGRWPAGAWVGLWLEPGPGTA